MSGLGTIEKLTQAHELDGFDRGQEALNRFLKRQAWVSQQANSARTYVLAEDGVVRGYYSLAAGSVTHEAASARVRKGRARHAIPVILIARLAVDRTLQGQGVGAGAAQGCPAANGRRRRDHRRPCAFGSCQGRAGARILRALRLRAEPERSAASIAGDEGP